jgi:hypothetical protein
VISVSIERLVGAMTVGELARRAGITVGELVRRAVEPAGVDPPMLAIEPPPIVPRRAPVRTPPAPQPRHVDPSPEVDVPPLEIPPPSSVPEDLATLRNSEESPPGPELGPEPEPEAELKPDPEDVTAAESTDDGDVAVPALRRRSKTIAARRISKDELRIGMLLWPERSYWRPATRGDCGVVRPCPYVACRHNLFLDVLPKIGSIKLNFPGLEPWEIEQSCSLDIAARGGVTLEEVGAAMNITRERVRQIETMAYAKIRAAGEAELIEALEGFVHPGDPT